MINNIRSHSFTLANASTELSQSSLDITKNTTNQSDMTVQAATAMEELAVSFLSVAQNSASAAEFSRDAETQAIEGGKVVTETVKSMDKIALTVNESAKTIGALGERSEQIGDIIRVINDIAGQTNLLALNAAIEAARAGEQGRGFAVVADEVRKLAEKTTLATQEIGEMIKGIQEETSAAVKSMESGTNEVESGVQQVNLAGNAFNEIVESIKQISDMVQQIATAAEEQSTTGTQVSSNLESVAEIARETAGVVQNSTESTQDLDLMAHELQQLVNDFKLRDGRNEGAKIVELKGPDEKKSNVVTGASPAF
jgi:methyl-accepting chemotaxis protein